MLTLAMLEKMRSVVSIAALSVALGYDRATLTNRIRRGRPELTPDESLFLLSTFSSVGLRVDTDKQQTS